MSVEHHAVLYFADDQSQLPTTMVARESAPDDRVLTFGTLSIDHVRTIQSLARQRPVHASLFRITVVADAIAHEAQHALLKTLEEPADTTRFVLVLRKRSPLLPTIWSRVVYMGDVRTEHTQQQALLTAFLAQSHALRLQEIADRSKAKDTDWLRILLAVLQRYVSSEMGKGKLSHAHIGHIAQDGIFADRSGASLKMLLEEVALSLPVVKL